MARQWIMGKNCLRELLRHAPERLVEVLTSVKNDPLIDDIENAGIRLRRGSQDLLTRLVETESHQGFIAQVKERRMIDFKGLVRRLQEGEKALVLLLDSIFDPHNLGAILRAAECFGVDGVIWSKNRGCDITPVVTKSSVGASELVPLVKVSNLAEAIRQLKQADFTAVTAEMDDAEPITSFHFPQKTALIMGSEGAGIRPLIRKLPDSKVSIPLHGHIDSLNVSQATAVLLSHYRQP